MTQLGTIFALNLSLLIKNANELGIKKEDIVQILQADGKFFLVYQVTINE